MSQRKVLRSTTKSKSSTSNSTKNKSGTGAPRLGMHQATPPFLGSRPKDTIGMGKENQTKRCLV